MYLTVKKVNVRSGEGVAQFCYVLVGGGQVICYVVLKKKGGLKNGKFGATERMNDPSIWNINKGPLHFRRGRGACTDVDNGGNGGKGFKLKVGILFRGFLREEREFTCLSSIIFSIYLEKSRRFGP